MNYPGLGAVGRRRATMWTVAALRSMVSQTVMATASGDPTRSQNQSQRRVRASSAPDGARPLPSRVRWARRGSFGGELRPVGPDGGHSAESCVPSGMSRPRR